MRRKVPTTDDLINEKLPSLDLSFEWVKDVLHDQRRTVDSLDTKTLTLFSLATVILGIGIAFGMLESSQNLATTVYGAFAIGAYVGVVLLTIYIVKPRIFETLENPEIIRQWYWDMPTKKFKLEILSHLEDAYKDNSINLREKVNAIRYLVPAMGAEVVLLVLALSFGT